MCPDVEVGCGKRVTDLLDTGEVGRGQLDLVKVRLEVGDCRDAGDRALSP